MRMEVDNKSLDNQTITSAQKLYTKTYVDLYKNDSLETLAATVVDNVYDYLSERYLPAGEINKNQISKDLVELGVKKTRKSKGYVYGLEDTAKDTHKESYPKFIIDESKLSRMKKFVKKCK